MMSEEARYDKFPVGMRVLAVDDDPICLKLLDTLLRKCQYQGLFPFSFDF
jgi:two-component response regulator (ARR-B family)